MNPNGRVRVRCAFYVARHDAIYTMSISAADNYREMSACVTTVANVLEGRCTESWRMLPGETLKYPDFVELDEVNDKVITYTEREHTFSVWTFAARPEDHRLLYRLSEATGHEMRAVAGLLLIVHHRTPTHVQVDLRAVETGERLESARFALHRGLKLQWFEVHERKVLLKEEGGPLQIWDLVTRARVELEPWHFSRGTRFAVEQGVVLALTAGRCVAGTWAGASWRACRSACCPRRSATRSRPWPSPARAPARSSSSRTASTTTTTTPRFASRTCARAASSPASRRASAPTARTPSAPSPPSPTRTSATRSTPSTSRAASSSGPRDFKKKTQNTCAPALFGDRRRRSVLVPGPRVYMTDMCRCKFRYTQ